MADSLKRTAEIVLKPVGSVIDPIITVSGIPTDVEVGQKITPSVLVERSAGVPVADVAIDFFVEDALQVSSLGTRQFTDLTGNATADEGYYVSHADAGTTLQFVVVVNRKQL